MNDSYYEEPDYPPTEEEIREQETRAERRWEAEIDNEILEELEREEK